MSDVDKIKERLGIVDVISTYIQVEKAGMGYKAKCPFHNEKTASFNISADRNLYYCFGCGARGDIFTFVEEFEGLDFSGALKFLADKAGVQLTGSAPKDKKTEDSLYKVMEEATSYYVGEFTGSKTAKEYLLERGVLESTMDEFRIGFAPEGWRNVDSALKSKGFSQEIIEKAGLIKSSDKEGKEENVFYDRFRNRIMFPITDTAGRVIAFSGRTLESRDDVAKYINSPETELFNKSDVLYGYDKAKGHIRTANACIVVEGQVDLLMAHQSGFPYTVAVSGTSFTGSHLSRIKRMTNNLIIAFDRDRAGIISTQKTAIMALGIGMNVRVALMPEGSDPADVIKGDKDAWSKLIKESPHVVDVFLDEISKKKMEQREYWKAVSKHVLPLVNAITDSIDRSHFVDSISTKTAIPKSSIEDELRKIVKEPQVTLSNTIRNEIGKTKDSLSKIDSIQRMITAILTWQEGKDEKDINTEKVRDSLGRILDGREGSDTDTSDVQGLIFEIERNYTDKDDIQRDTDELVLLLEEAIITEKLKALAKDISSAESIGDKSELNDFMKEHLDASKKLEEVKQKIKSRAI